MTLLDFIPSASVIAAYTVTSVILTFTPGPDMSYFLGKAITHGRSGGVAALLGTNSGLIIHSTAVALGLTALLAASPTAFFVLKAAGAAWLLFLAVQALRHGSAFSLPEARPARAPLAGIYAKGFLTNILNPKIIVFFVTFLPQFIDPGEAHPGAKLFFLGIYFIAICTPLSLGMIWSAGRIARALKSNPRAMRVFDWCFAGILGAFAVRLALAQAK